MKINRIYAALIMSSLLFFASNSKAGTILVTNPGNWNWSSTVANQPWPNGTLPTSNDFVEVYDNIIITNDMTNAMCQALDSSQGTYENGEVVMAPGSTLYVSGQNEGFGTEFLGALNATATNSTVVYQGNSFWAMKTNYWNLVFSGWGDFYNGYQNGQTATPMTIYHNFYVTGTNVAPDQPNYTGCYVQCGDWITVLGNLYIAASNTFDCSTSMIMVAGQTICAGTLFDASGGIGSNYFAGGLTILSNNMIITNLNNVLFSTSRGWTNVDYLAPNGTPSGTTNIYGGAWYIGDATEWAVGANLTNDGIIGFGKNYGNITFTGNGIIGGIKTNIFIIPTMTINATNEVADNIILTTNCPVVNGTEVFDLANSNQIVLNAGTNVFWYTTNGNLNVINSGPAPVLGSTYQLFNNVGSGGYGGEFASTILPSLSTGLSWTNELLVNGSIAVVGQPTVTITSSRYNPGTLQFTLTWSSLPGANYTIYESPTLNPTAWSPLQTNIPSGGSTTTATVTMPAGTKGFLRVMMQ
ncbi:MAG TPA: hypothetical protein VMA35_07050 [Candidatus Sulfopaludibacter sp.]|nr:hypothetical protein [Candidatus Sulfopaludibacter sp.]